MAPPLRHPEEVSSNAPRACLAAYEPRALRTYTPTQAVIARSAGVFHWTPEGRRLYDFTSGVLVANLGHNPSSWMQRFVRTMNWQDAGWQTREGGAEFFSALPLTAYNAVTPVEMEPTRRLVGLLQSLPARRRR